MTIFSKLFFAAPPTVGMFGCSCIPDTPRAPPGGRLMAPPSGVALKLAGRPGGRATDLGTEIGSRLERVVLVVVGEARVFSRGWDIAAPRSGGPERDNGGLVAPPPGRLFVLVVDTELGGPVARASGWLCKKQKSTSVIVCKNYSGLTFQQISKQHLQYLNTNSVINCTVKHQGKCCQKWVIPVKFQ